jgi:putative serine protease PepD
MTRNGIGAVAAALAAMFLSAPVAVAEAQVCGRSARDVFADNGDRVFEVFSLGINPFRVHGRVVPRGGTGFLIDDGHIVTNYHVVADASEIVVFDDERPYDVRVVGIDPTLDIAVVRTFPPIAGTGIRFAGPEAIEIGATAYAIGFPLGVGKSISAGVISGVSRILPRTTSSWLSPFLQTDAAISPGNSGGPLLDDCGQLIGMITAGISTEGAENLGFAIPVGVLRPVVEELIATGEVARPWHGIYGQMTSPPILTMLGIPQEEWDRYTGFLVETVEPGSAADRAGLIGGSWPVMWGGTEILLGGDIITEVDGERIRDRDQALDKVRSLRIGQEVELTYYRGGRGRTVFVSIERRPVLAQELEIYRWAQ